MLVEPAVSLVLGAENHFSASPSSFKFASNEMLLKYQLSHHPLTLEVWTSGEATDSLVGIAKVGLLWCTYCLSSKNIFFHFHRFH